MIRLWRLDDGVDASRRRLPCHAHRCSELKLAPEPSNKEQLELDGCWILTSRPPRDVISWSNVGPQFWTRNSQQQTQASRNQSITNTCEYLRKICNHNYFRCFTRTRETCYGECVSGYGCSQGRTSFQVYFYLTRGSEDVLSDLHSMHSVNSAEASNIFKIPSTCLIHCYKLQPHMFWSYLYSTCMGHGNNISMSWHRSGRHVLFRKSLRETALAKTDRTI